MCVYMLPRQNRLFFIPERDIENTSLIIRNPEKSKNKEPSWVKCGHAGHTGHTEQLEVIAYWDEKNQIYVCLECA